MESPQFLVLDFILDYTPRAIRVLPLRRRYIMNNGVETHNKRGGKSLGISMSLHFSGDGKAAE
jgi:hypothetical protein